MFYSMKSSKHTQSNPEDNKMNIKRSQWSKAHDVAGTLFFHTPWYSLQSFVTPLVGTTPIHHF